MGSYSEQLTFLSSVSIATGGTAQQIQASPFLQREFFLEAKTGNTSNLCISDTQAKAEAGDGTTLAPGQAITLGGTIVESRQVDFDISNLWVVSDTTGDALVVSYKERINKPDD